MKKSKINVPKPRQKFTTGSIVLYILVTIIVVIICAYVGTAMHLSSVGETVKIEKMEYNFNIIANNPKIILNTLKIKNSYAMKMVWLGFMAMLIFILFKYSEPVRRTHRLGVEHGSAKWADEKEINPLADKNDKQYQVLKDSNGKYIFDENGEFKSCTIDNNIILTNNVSLSLNTYTHQLNLNVLIVGSAGSGKSRYYVVPNIMQLSTSYVVTDPKGEILRATGKLLKQAGYKVRVLNLINMENSHNYNPFHYVYDEYGNASEDNIKKMVDVMVKNTKGKGEQDDFWAQKGQALIEAIVFLLFEESEYNAEYEEITVNDKKIKRIKPGTRDTSKLNFFAVTEKMRKLQYPHQGKTDGFLLEQGKNESDEDFFKRQEEAFLCPLDKDFIELRRRKGETLAGRLYHEVRNAPEETGQSFLSSANIRTFFFNLTNLRNLTSCDNIHLETIGDEKTALFVITPATNRTYKFIAACLYTQMFDVLANRANFKYSGTLPVHVRCMMDEFYNIGEIPDFDVVIGYVRSMGISLNIVLQNLSQLKAMYEKTWENVTGNCNSFLFLGGDEESTLKYISEKLGKETIDVRSQNRTRGGKSSSTSENNSIMGRELMQPNEISTMPRKDCILLITSHNPMYCAKYICQDHPNYKFIGFHDSANEYDISDIHTIAYKDDTSEKSISDVDTAIQEDNIILEIEKSEIKYETFDDILESDNDIIAEALDTLKSKEYFANTDTYESFDLGEPTEEVKIIEEDISEDDGLSVKEAEIRTYFEGNNNDIYTNEELPDSNNIGSAIINVDEQFLSDYQDYVDDYTFDTF